MTDDIYKTPSTTPNFKTELAAKLAELVPEAVADGKVDVVKLQELLANDAVEGNERFGLFWPGKKRALRAAQEPTTATLKPDFENSKDWDTTKNVFIEGDNLEVLKILQKYYHGKINLIYIDPPYNTGSDFVYPDNYREGLDAYLDWTRQVTEEGQKLSSNSETDGRYHSNWLNMMYPRLKLARNLLKDDGVIFVSIGSQELSNLIALCNQVFGEANVLCTFSREQKSGSNQGDIVAPQLDYVVACAKSREYVNSFVVRSKELERENEKSLYQASLDPMRGCVNQRYWIEAPDGSFIIPPGQVFPDEVKDGANIPPQSRDDKVWRWSWSSYLAQKDQLRFKSTGRGTLIDQHGNPSKWNVYTVKSNHDSEMRPRDYIFGMTNSAGTVELDRLGLGRVFDNPKPTDLIRYLIEISGVPTDAVILDFFAGSGTTAHAVLAANAADGGSRNFMLVQLPEPTEEGSEARRANFTSLSEIARKRVLLAADEIRRNVDATLSFRESEMDLGFRAYKLADTNFGKWRVASDVEEDALQQHLLSLRNSASDDASADELLTEILLKQGYSLTEDCLTSVIDGLEVQLMRDRDGDIAVVALLSEHVKPTLEQLRALVAESPTRIIVLEDAFQGDDELKTNLAQLCKSQGIELWTA